MERFKKAKEKAERKLKLSDKEKEERELQKKEDLAYETLTKLGYSVEMSEGYIPIYLRGYCVYKGKEVFMSGNLDKFIKFAEEQK